MNAIAKLVMVAIGLYVGINLLPGMNTTVAQIVYPTYARGVVGMMGVALIVFAAMMVFVVVKSMSDSG